MADLVAHSVYLPGLQRYPAPQVLPDLHLRKGSVFKERGGGDVAHPVPIIRVVDAGAVRVLNPFDPPGNIIRPADLFRAPRVFLRLQPAAVVLVDVHRLSLSGQIHPRGLASPIDVLRG